MSFANDKFKEVNKQEQKERKRKKRRHGGKK
jgi:hypothetical protein